MAAAARHGRDRTPPAPEGPDASQTERLRRCTQALVPYFAGADDPAPLYAHGGEWEKAYAAHEFDDAGRIGHLVIRYPAYFPDGDPQARARIEQLLTVKAGRSREYHFAWDEEGNQLTVTALAPLPADIPAQRFVTAPGETVLGFTDPSEVQRTLPLSYGEERIDVPPVVWRTGIRSTEPHLLAMGHPRQRHVHPAAVHRPADPPVRRRADRGTAVAPASTRARPAGRGSSPWVRPARGRWPVWSGPRRGPSGGSSRSTWPGRRATRRREDTRRPLWILLDRPGVFAHLATADGRKDPQTLLQVPLRHGRAANVTVVVAEQFDSAEALSDAVRQHTRARVVLGTAEPQQVEAVLGMAPHTTPMAQVPPGRGYARLGSGPVHRLQVPRTPDPYDDATSDADRQAVLELLPPRATAVGAAHPSKPADLSKPTDKKAPVAAEAMAAES